MTLESLQKLVKIDEYTLKKFEQSHILPATSVPEVIVSTLSTIPLEGLDRRKITPNIKLAIGTQRLIALYIGIFMPFRANKAEQLCQGTYIQVYKKKRAIQIEAMVQDVPLDTFLWLDSFYTNFSYQEKACKIRLCCIISSTNSKNVVIGQAVQVMLY